MRAQAVDERREAEPPADVLDAYPEKAQRIGLPDGEEMAVVDAGPRWERAVVLLHGNPTWGFLWRALVPPLAAAGHRVVVPDHVGFGRSTKPAAAYHSLPRHADNLGIALDALGVRRAVLVLHDWGGPIGLHWAARHLDRVAGIVVTNTVAFPPRRKRSLSPFHALFASAVGGPLGRNMNLVVEAAIRGGVARPMPDVARRAYRWPFPTAAAREAPLAMTRLVPNGPDHPTAAALGVIEDALPAMADVPAVVLWGDRDRVLPPRVADLWAKRLPGVRRIERYRAGHFLQEDVPEALAASVLRFLGEEGVP